MTIQVPAVYIALMLIISVLVLWYLCLSAIGFIFRCKLDEIRDFYFDKYYESKVKDQFIDLYLELLKDQNECPTAYYILYKIGWNNEINKLAEKFGKFGK